MYKVAWLVKLAPDGDREALTRAWDGEHADLMRVVPGLERHTVKKGLGVAGGAGARRGGGGRRRRPPPWTRSRAPGSPIAPGSRRRSRPRSGRRWRVTAN